MTTPDTDESGFPNPAPDAPPPPGARTGDPIAPYGVTAGGTVRKKPGRKPSAKAAPAAIPAPKKIPTRTPPAPKKTQTDYGPALTALAGEAIGPMAILGVMKNDPVMVADAATITNGLPALVMVANGAADKWPVVAAILDKVCAVGPYAGAVGGLTLMVGQLGVNHGLIPPGLIPGTMAPAQLAEQFVKQRAAESKEFAAALEHIAAKMQALRETQRMAQANQPE